MQLQSVAPHASHKTIQQFFLFRMPIRISLRVSQIEASCGRGRRLYSMRFVNVPTSSIVIEILSPD
jgi:hypothetical protein